MKYNKGFTPIAILLIMLGMMAVGGVAYFAMKSSIPKNELSDNSNYFPPTEQNYTPSTENYNSPQNQQTQAPSTIERPEGPLDYSDNKFTINAPAISTTLPQYVGSHADCDQVYKTNGVCWPPKVITSNQAYSCPNISATPNTEGNDVTAQRIINGKTYCIHSLSSSYAGGRGYTYTYTRANGSGTKTTTFGLIYQSCGVYGGPTDPQVVQCNSIQTNFINNLDALIDSLM